MTVTETFPSYFIGRNPDRRVIATSYGDSLARKFGRLNRQKVDDFGADVFGLAVSKGSASITNWTVDKRNSKNEWETRRGGMISTGIQGTMTGEGADLFIVDDPVKNRREADSETYQEMVWSEYQSTIQTRLQPKGSIIIIVTRWNERDLVGRILEQERDQWEVLSLAAVCEEPGKDEPPDPLGRNIGQSLWPQSGYNEEWADKKKISVGGRVWASLYQQRPTSAEGSIFKRSYWKFYRELPEVLHKIQTWDTGAKEKQDSDPSACLTAAACKNGYYLIDRLKRKMEYPEIILQMKLQWAKHNISEAPLERLVVEDASTGQSAIPSLRMETALPVFGWTPKGKILQANSVSPLLEAGKVFLPVDDKGVPLPWAAEMIEECAKFPNAKHDEDVDILCMALLHLRLYNRDLIHTSDEAEDDLGEQLVQTVDQRGNVVHAEPMGTEAEKSRYTHLEEKLFHESVGDAQRDTQLNVCKEYGHVPYGCLMVGAIVMAMVRDKIDPCGQCGQDRAVCRGRARKIEEEAA